MFANPHPQVVQDRDIPTYAAQVRLKMKALEDLAAGGSRFLIVTGPAGIGKTFTMGKGLSKRKNFNPKRFFTHSGNLTDRKLYYILYDGSPADAVTVLDDTDQTLMNNKARALIKGATGQDANGKYMCEWSTASIGNARSNAAGHTVPDKFEFQGSLFIITNKPLDAMAKGNTIAAPDYHALISRMRLFKCHFDEKAVYSHIFQLLPYILQAQMPNDPNAQLVGAWFLDNFFLLRDKSFRTLNNMIDSYIQNPATWQSECQYTLLDI